MDIIWWTTWSIYLRWSYHSIYFLFPVGPDAQPQSCVLLRFFDRSFQGFSLSHQLPSVVRIKASSRLRWLRWGYVPPIIEAQATQMISMRILSKLWFHKPKLWGYDGVDVRPNIRAVEVARKPDDGVANDPDDGAADVPVDVVTLDVNCSVLFYNLWNHPWHCMCTLM